MSGEYEFRVLLKALCCFRAIQSHAVILPYFQGEKHKMLPDLFMAFGSSPTTFFPFFELSTPALSHLRGCRYPKAT